MPNATCLRRAAYLLFYGLLPFFAIGQTDTVPPQLSCKNPLEIALPFCGQLPFFLQPYELLDSYSDNTTPAAQLVLRARRACLGTGFPEIPSPMQFQPLVFLANDLYHSFPLEIWARDEAGNTAMCMTSVYFNESGFCDPGLMTYGEVYFAGTNIGIPGVRITIRGGRCAGDSMDIHGETGIWNGEPALWKEYSWGIPSGYNFSVTAKKNTHPLNGITMHDLFLISQHIQGITPLTNPHQLIAADANQDGQITEEDRLILRRLISGTISELPNGRSWRFVPADFGFDPLQPLVFPEKFEVAGTNYPSQYFHFRGVKIGDVDFSADPNQ